jgi:tRNA pseudouridine55 synthase
MRAQRAAEPTSFARRKRDKKPLQVKIGHGGTLDPLATGVLIVGIGSGTKALSRFLACTKSYECVVVFGVESDSLDVLGKVVRTTSWEGVSRESVEEKLAKFRGKIMQVPPNYSAKRINGERAYTLAREGREIPKGALQAKEMRVDEMELIEFWEEGEHEWKMTTENRDDWENRKKRKVSPAKQREAIEPPPKKVARKESDESLLTTASGAKIPPTMTGALSMPEVEDDDTLKAAEEDDKVKDTPESPAVGPAARIRMTVTSGFYVRSLCHDLGEALGSAGVMAELVRTRQGGFELGRNVIEYEDVEKDEEAWGPSVRKYLEEWQKQEQAAIDDDSDR